ncbi:MAG: nickel transporter, partial [Acidimicrobiia bacterium]|nr:nickel transporter [Acidimicrobiia bacterium]
MTTKVRPKRLAGRALAAGAAATLLGLAFATPASAHPLGNFTFNTSAAVQVRPDEVLVDYVIDLAELPTLQARPDVDRNGDGSLTDGERRRYAEQTCDRAAARLNLTVGDRPVVLEHRSSDISFPEGQAGLRTLRLECELGGSSTEIDGRTTVRLADENFADRLGWREIIALGDRTTVTDTDVLRESASDTLVNYPQDQLESPLRQREATITVEPGGPALVQDDDDSPIPLPSADRLSSLISEQKLTIPFALFALAVSFVLGGFHAVAPGHGKTVMAAYLVGQRGARRQALLLGATVAVTHTGGVLALALVVSNSAVAPERFYPVLGSISGLLVVAIGVVLLRRAVEFRRIFPTLGPGASRHHHHGIGGHTHTHDLATAS